MAAPLVSIMTRTLGRPCLADAAAAVAAQTWRPLEWVVVDAAGRGLEAPVAGDVPVRVVSSGAPMLRSRAGNFGLDRVAGARALILDDDDLLLPHAIAALSAALDASPAHRVAYGDVRVDTGDPDRWGVYAFEYSELLVTKRNLFPPVAALFDMTLWRDEGVRYDEALDWYDDWWVFLQMSAHTAFLHVRDVTAIYRLVLSESGNWHGDDADGDPRVLATRDELLARGATRRAALEARYLTMKADARAREAAGDLAGAAEAWGRAHAFFHYDPEPIAAYAAIARAAGDLVAARSALASGLALMPGEPALAQALAALDAVATGRAEPAP
jgi:hypothetical protein